MNFLQPSFRVAICYIINVELKLTNSIYFGLNWGFALWIIRGFLWKGFSCLPCQFFVIYSKFLNL